MFNAFVPSDRRQGEVRRGVPPRATEERSTEGQGPLGKGLLIVNQCPAGSTYQIQGASRGPSPALGVHGYSFNQPHGQGFLPALGQKAPILVLSAPPSPRLCCGESSHEHEVSPRHTRVDNRMHPPSEVYGARSGSQPSSAPPRPDPPHPRPVDRLQMADPQRGSDRSQMADMHPRGQDTGSLSRPRTPIMHDSGPGATAMAQCKQRRARSLSEPPIGVDPQRCELLLALLLLAHTFARSCLLTKQSLQADNLLHCIATVLL